MTIPTKTWSPGDALTPSGFFETWDAAGVEAETMVADFVTVLKPWFPASVNFDSYQIFTLASPTSPKIPVFSNAIGGVGTQADPGWNLATQLTWTLRTTVNSIFKLVLLDAGTLDDWNLITPTSLTGVVEDVFDVLSGVQYGFSARVDGRPSTFLQISKTLNEKLRREYRLQ